MKETLSSKIQRESLGYDRLDVIPTKDVKDFIQNSERRIKEVISMEWSKGMDYILKEIEEIFIEEAGEELLEDTKKGLKVIDGTPTAISNYLIEREKEDTKKGCGSLYDQEQGYYKVCGEHGLCSTCSKKGCSNHSPQLKKKVNHMRKSAEDALRGNHSPQGKRSFRDISQPEDNHGKKGCGKVSDFTLNGIKNWVCLQDDENTIIELIKFSHKKLKAIQECSKKGDEDD